jgi:hypothetical protein
MGGRKNQEPGQMWGLKREKKILGASPARGAQGPGFPLQSFGLRQKDFRFNPWR